MRTAVVPALLLLSGCVAATRDDQTTAPRARLDTEFTLALGGLVSLEGTPYSVVFMQVIEDSRCAHGLTCIWEGNARIELGIFESGVPNFTLQLNTSPRIPTERYDAGFVIELRGLDPEPREGLHTGGYTATLFARKK